MDLHHRATQAQPAACNAASRPQPSLPLGRLVLRRAMLAKAADTGCSHASTAASAPYSRSATGHLACGPLCLMCQGRRAAGGTARRRRAKVQAAAQQQRQPADTAVAPLASARAAVEAGLQAFASGRTEAALELFQAALQMSPDDDEARAALFNSACCHARAKRWAPAAQAVADAVNKHSLKLSSALEDPDLAALRQTREWLDALATMRGAPSDRLRVGLRSEIKAPWRLPRLTVAGGLAAGAGLGLLIIAARLAAALRGGEGAPDLAETLRNFAVNVAAVGALAFVISRDLRAARRSELVVEREEALARLQVRLGGSGGGSGARVLPLAALRGSVRPVLLAGSRPYLQRAVAAATACKAELQERGVALVLLPASAPAASSSGAAAGNDDEAGGGLQLEDADAKIRALRDEFQQRGSGDAKGFGKPAAKPAGGSSPGGAGGKKAGKDERWQLEAHEPAEWLQWLEAQQAAAGVTGKEGCYVQVQLDGSVRASGTGQPPWEAFLGDLAPLDDVRTRFTDGAAA